MDFLDTWIFHFVLVMVIPLVMIIEGKRYKDMSRQETDKRYANRTKRAYGYRSTRAVLNQDAWYYTQQRFGRTWFYWGLVIILPSIIPMLVLIGKEGRLISKIGLLICIIQLLVIFISFIRIEIDIRKTYDKKGNKIK